MWQKRVSPALLLAILLSGGVLQAGISLVERSPFVWPGFDSSTAAATAGVAAVSSSDFEFHAVYELSGLTRVLLKDNKNNTFHWLVVGEESEGLLIKSYNKENNQLVFAYENQEKSLELKSLPQWVSTPLASGAGRPATTSAAQAARTSVSSSTQSSSTSTPRRTVVTRPLTSTRTSAPRTLPRPPPMTRGRPAVTGNPAFQPADFTPPPAPSGDPDVTPPKVVPTLNPGVTPPKRP